MAVTVAEIYDSQAFVPELKNGQLCGLFNVTLDSSYPTGGEDLTEADLGLPAGATVSGAIASATGGYVAHYDHANDKLIMYTGGSQVANTTDLSAVVVTLHVWYTR